MHSLWQQNYAITPINWRGKLVFAIGCGIITMLIRLFGSLPEGVSYSIVLMNILTPHIESFDSFLKPLVLSKPERSGNEVKFKPKEIAVPALILCAICLIITGALSVTNFITKDTIEL